MASAIRPRKPRGSAGLRQTQAKAAGEGQGGACTTKRGRQDARSSSATERARHSDARSRRCARGRGAASSAKTGRGDDAAASATPGDTPRAADQQPATAAGAERPRGARRSLGGRGATRGVSSGPDAAGRRAARAKPLRRRRRRKRLWTGDMRGAPQWERLRRASARVGATASASRGARREQRTGAVAVWATQSLGARGKAGGE